jgi:hypothetical protein
MTQDTRPVLPKGERSSPRKRRASFYSTVMGYVVAIAQAWITIDFSHFAFTTEWWTKAAPNLLLSAVIAIGGHMTSINRLARQ